MVEKLSHNSDLNIELTSYIDDKQNVWFRGKDIALILSYSKARDALSRHVDSEASSSVSRVDKMFVVKVFCNIVSILPKTFTTTRLTAPGSPRMIVKINS